jgi:hypothetical protein
LKTIQNIERGKQRGRSMAFVIMGHGLGSATLERQPWLRAVKCLHLALLVTTQHHGAFGRAHVQPHDIGELLFEPDVIGDFERLAQMWLEAVRAPDARYRGCTGTGLFGHRARAPLRCRFRLGLRGQLHNPLSTHPGRASATRGVFFYPSQSKLHIPRNPAPNARRANIEFLRNDTIGKTRGRHQHHIGAHCATNTRQTRRTPDKQGIQVVWAKLDNYSTMNHPGLLETEIISFG